MHRSFDAHPALKYFLAIAGAAQLQWSIMWWGRHHRAHHQYTDTDQDPYNARRGFWYAHIGWLLGLHETPWGAVDIADLEADPVVRWQRRYYAYLALLGNFVVPTAVAHFGWDDWRGGLVYGSCLRLSIIHNITFLVNSLSHMPWAGWRPYSDRWTATNVPVVAVVAGGEGSHNFHHAFPTDYRAGEDEWFVFDLGRLFLDLCARLGLVWGVVRVSPAELRNARLRQAQRQRRLLDETGVLPVMDWETVRGEVQQGRSLVGVEGFVHDVAGFMAEHPGGADLLERLVGEDATGSYLHGKHRHSPNADAILAGLRCAVIPGMS